MGEKTIGQVVYERARDELHKDYFDDVRRIIRAFGGSILNEATHSQLQMELNYSYAKFVVLQSQPMARIFLSKFKHGEDFTITIKWPPSPWDDGANEVHPTCLPR